MPQSPSQTMSLGQCVLVCANTTIASTLAQRLPATSSGEFLQWLVWGGAGLLLIKTWRLSLDGSAVHEGKLALSLLAMLFWGIGSVTLSQRFALPVVVQIAIFGAVVVPSTLRWLFDRRTSPAVPIPRVSLSFESRVLQDEIDSSLEERLLASMEESPEDPFDAELEDDDQPVVLRDNQRTVLQRLERGVNPDGGEWLEGMILVEFQAGQRTAIVHLPFWPAFAVDPRVDCELIGGPELRVELNTVKRWGIRLELIRNARHLDPDAAELAFFVNARTALSEAA